LKEKGLVLLLLFSSVAAVVLASRLPREATVIAERPAESVPNAGTTPEPSLPDHSSYDDIGGPLPLPLVTEWTNFTVRDGLPSNKVFSIRIDGDRIWAGTDQGLACYESGRWAVIGVKDGLPHQAVLSLDVSPQTGDLWVGTMGGLARITGGRIDVFTQTSSGLSNNFVNEVQCDPDENVVWAATAMGLSRYDVASNTWQVYTHENTPMHEPWVYSVAVDRGMVYVGAWGAGILEYTKADGRWREYRDPDGEMEIDLLPNDGPVHDVTSAVDFAGGVLWQGSYMGMASYNGSEWRSYYKEDSGLPSNFVNFVRARGRVAWVCTDSGLSVTDSERWLTYRKIGAGGEIAFSRSGEVIRNQRIGSVFPHNFVLSADVQADSVWLATEGGVSRGHITGTWDTAESMNAESVARREE